MENTVIKFVDIEIEKQKINKHKSLILVINIDIYKILKSNKISLGKEGYKYNGIWDS